MDEAQCSLTQNCHVTRLDGKFWGCWELTPSGRVAGQCNTLDAISCTSRDDCVGRYQLATIDSTTPRFDSCADELAPPSCDTLTTEIACKARMDCEPVYNGLGCTCDPHGCTCQTETFDHCQPRP
jgi:hypothetical protein